MPRLLRSPQMAIRRLSMRSASRSETLGLASLEQPVESAGFAFLRFLGSKVVVCS
jgi:hypothetical protein